MRATVDFLTATMDFAKKAFGGGVKGSGVNCAKHPKGRWRQLTPDPFTSDPFTSILWQILLLRLG